MSTATVYALLDACGTVRYVGKATNLRRRIAAHKKARPWYAGHLVLEIVPPGGNAAAAERRHIETWNQWGDLENVRNGGNGGETRSAETRARMSAAMRGRPNGRLGKHHSAETRAKISAALTGRHPTTETRAKLREANLGKKRGPMSAELRAKISAARRST